MRTEAALRIFAHGDEVDGFEVGGLWATHGYPPIGQPVAPIEEWPRGTTVDLSRMHGPGWVAPLWRFRIHSWPPATAWHELVLLTLERMMESGASIAWMAGEANFADPPELFNPYVMGDGVFAALSSVTGFICTAEPGRPMKWLPPFVQEQLRSEATRLVDLRLPDPDVEDVR